MSLRTGPETAQAPLGPIAGSPAPSGRWWRGDFVATAVAVLLWQAALTAFGVIVERAFHPLQAGEQGARLPPPSLLQHTLRWDGFYFRDIPHGLYQLEPKTPAFYPLFPFLARAVELASFGALGILAAGLLLNTVATWLAATALLRTARDLTGSTSWAWLSVAALLCAPTAYFLHVFYSEATFIAFAFWAHRFATQGRWTAMGLCLVPLTASRITAVLFVGLCFLEFWKAQRWRLRGLVSPAVLWFPAAFLGFGAYALYLYRLTGEPLGMLNAYERTSDWSYHVFDPNIAATLARQAGVVADAVRGTTGFSNYLLVNQVLPLLGLVVLLLASAYLLVALRADGIPLAAFGVASFVMFTLNSNTVSVHRYLLVCVSIHLAAALLAARRRWARSLLFAGLYVGVLVQGALMVLFVSNQWSG